MKIPSWQLLMADSFLANLTNDQVRELVVAYCERFPGRSDQLRAALSLALAEIPS